MEQRVRHRAYLFKRPVGPWRSTREEAMNDALAAGAWVHFHDIYFPYDYQRGILDDELFFSNESVLLHALLINNRALTVRAASGGFAKRSKLDQLLQSFGGASPANRSVIQFTACIVLACAARP